MLYRKSFRDFYRNYLKYNQTLKLNLKYIKLDFTLYVTSDDVNIYAYVGTRCNGLNKEVKIPDGA